MTSTTRSNPLASIAVRLGVRWWVPVIVGVFWIITGFAVLRFDTSTIPVVSIIFGVMVLLAAAGEIFRAVFTPGGWRVWHLVFAVLLVVGAVVILINPGRAFVSVALVVGVYFVFIGTFDIVSALFNTGHPGWWLLLLSGIAQLVLGYFASSSFQNSVVVLVTYVGALTLFRGVSEIAAGFTIRGLAKPAA